MTARCRRWIKATVTAVVLALAVAAPAHAWTEPAITSLDSARVDSYSVAMDADGNAVATWVGYVDGISKDQIQTRSMSASGARSPIQNVAKGGSSSGSPRIAVAPDGNAVIVWVDAGYISARQLSDSGVLGPTLHVSPSSHTYSPDVAIDPSGNAVVVWVSGDPGAQRVQARTVSAAGVVGAVQYLSPAAYGFQSLGVGVDADGDALIAWERRDSSTTSAVQSVTRTTDGTLGAVRNLSPSGQKSTGARVSVAPDGSAVVGWSTNDGTNSRAQIRTLDTAGTAPSPTQTLSGAGADATSVRVAIAPDGRATAGWLLSGSPYRIQLRQRAPDATLSPTLTLMSTATALREPDLAANGSGDVMVAWEASDGTYRTWTRELTGVGTLMPARVLSAHGMTAFGPTDVARSPASGGGAVVAWEASDAGIYQRLDMAVEPSALGAPAAPTLAAAAPAPAVRAAAAPVNSNWSTPDSLSPDGSQVTAVAVGMDQNANTVTVWSRNTGPDIFQIQTGTRYASGGESSVQMVSSNSNPAGNLRVAVAPDGSAVIVWTRDINGVERVQARQLSAAGVLGPTFTLSSSAKSATLPDVAVDSSGNALIAWQWFGAGTDYRIQVRALSAGGVLSPTQNVSAAGDIARFASVASAPDGRAVIAWQRHEGTDFRAQMATRSAAGALSPAENLSAPGADANEVQAAIAPSGDAVASWTRFDGANTRLQARGESAAGVLDAIQTVSLSGNNAGGSRLAMAPDGTATLVWQRDAGSIQLRRRAPGGTLGSILTFAGSNPEVALDADGDAIVAWPGGAKESFADGSFNYNAKVLPSGMKVPGQVDVARAPDGRASIAWVASWGPPFARADVSVGP